MLVCVFILTVMINLCSNIVCIALGGGDVFQVIRLVSLLNYKVVSSGIETVSHPIRFASNVSVQMN